MDTSATPNESNPIKRSSSELGKMNHPTVLQPVKKKSGERYLMIWIPVKAVDHLNLDENTKMMCYVDDSRNLVYHPMNTREKKLSLPIPRMDRQPEASSHETVTENTVPPRRTGPSKIKPIAHAKN